MSRNRIIVTSLARRSGQPMHALSLKENWVGLESNPEVLTEYAHKMGVSKYADQPILHT